ncbi:MAG: dihydromonapterin reductase [Halothiobacillaceae bacterium]
MLENAILLTGAGQRLGLFHAERILDRGWPLIVTYRTPRPSVERLAARGAVVLQADLFTLQGIEGLIAQVQAHAASLRAIIHNASFWPTDAELAADPSLFDALMNLHVRTPWRLNDALAPLLYATSAPFADIIHITDTTITKGSAKRAAYIASKAALDSLTRSFAARLAPKVKVNSIAPGLILFNAGDDEAYRQDRLRRSALGYEPGAMVVWQAIDGLLANGFITGQSLAVDGGRNVK